MKKKSKAKKSAKKSNSKKIVEKIYDRKDPVRHEDGRDLTEHNRILKDAELRLENIKEQHKKRFSQK